MLINFQTHLKYRVGQKLRPFSSTALVTHCCFSPRSKSLKDTAKLSTVGMYSAGS